MQQDVDFLKRRIVELENVIKNMAILQTATDDLGGKRTIAKMELDKALSWLGWK